MGGEGQPDLVGPVGGGFAFGDLEGDRGLRHRQGGELFAHRSGEFVRGGPADLGERRGGRLHGLASLGEFGVESVEVAVLGFEFGEFRGRAGFEVEDFGDVLAVGSQGAELRAACFGLLQRGFAEFVETGEVVRQFRGGVG